jgi:hypothetical protein
VTANDTDRPVRLLHLSDLHFRAGTAWDADPVLRALAGFVRREAGAGLAPDLVAVTGDLAFAGKAEEYRLAQDWFEGELWPALALPTAPPLPHDRLLLIPGNHDADRGRVGTGARHIQDGQLAARSQDAIAALLNDDDERDLILKRHAAYLDFYGDWLDQAQGLPWWQRTLEVRGQRLHLAGLDSAWMACGDDDRGRLLLGRRQLNQTVVTRESEGADWRLALLHHPWDYLAEFDTHEARQTIHLHRDLVLRGHLHEGDASYVRPPDPTRACLELAAGCCYDGSRHPNAFQWIELWPQTPAAPRRVRVLFRAWVKGAWAIDRNQPGCPDGVAEFPLPRAADPLTPPPHTRRTRAERSGGSDRPVQRRVPAVDEAPVSRVDQDPDDTHRADPAAPNGASPAGIAEDPPLFDCFLSHNSKDKPAVRALAAELGAAGLSVWFDEERLRPGLPWQPQLESGITASRSVAVLVGADGLGPWEDEEQQAALTLAVHDKRPVIPVLLPTAPQVPNLPLFLRNRTWVDLRTSAAPAGVGRLDRLIWGITGKKPGAVIRDGADSAPLPEPEPSPRSADTPDGGSQASATVVAATREPEPPLDDGGFDRHWQAFRDRNRQDVAAALARYPVLLRALSVQLAQIGRGPELDAVVLSDTERVRACADGLLALDFDAFAGVAAALYRQLRDAAETAGRAAGDERGALDTLLGLMLRLAPLLYDQQLARTTYVSRGASFGEVPAALYAVAELMMAAEGARAAAYQRRKGPEGDDPRGLACVSADMPELGIDATTDDYCERFLVHLGRKDLSREAFRKDRFLHDCDRFLEHFYPSASKRTPHGSSDEELLADRRCAIDAQLTDWPEKRKGRPYQIYTVFRPETQDELDEMRTTAEELHRRYPSLRILFLTASRRDGNHRWDLEMARLKAFCRILRFHD